VIVQIWAATTKRMKLATEL